MFVFVVGQNVGRRTAESADLKHWRIARQARNRVVHQIKVARFQHSRVRVAKANLQIHPRYKSAWGVGSPERIRAVLLSARAIRFLIEELKTKLNQ